MLTLATTYYSSDENKRIEEEAGFLGHEFELIDLRDFSFFAGTGSLEIKKITKIDTDILIFRSIFQSVKPISVIIKNLRQSGVRVFDNNLSSHKYSIDKISDFLKLSAGNISIPKTFYSREYEDYLLHANKLGFPLIVKSARSGRGDNIFKLESKEELENLINNLQNEGKEARSFIMQEYIDYQYDLRCLIIGKNIFTMQRIPSEGEFRANYSLGGRVEKYEPSDSNKKLATKALEAVGMGMGGVDILIDKENRSYVLEVNHAPGFAGMERATGENIARVFLQHAVANAS